MLPPKPDPDAVALYQSMTSEQLQTLRVAFTLDLVVSLRGRALSDSGLAFMAERLLAIEAVLYQRTPRSDT